jgi:hypothetical protein
MSLQSQKRMRTTNGKKTLFQQGKKARWKRNLHRLQFNDDLRLQQRCFSEKYRKQSIGNKDENTARA